MRRVACHSYIEACGDPFGGDAPFQFHLGVRYHGLERIPEGYTIEQIEEMWWDLRFRNIGDSESSLAISGKTVTIKDAFQQIEAILSNLPESVKIVSVSYSGNTPAGLLGADLPFASIEAGGNTGRDNFLDLAIKTERPNTTRRRAAAAADKALFVAGYDVSKAEEYGIFVRHSGSVGCVDDSGFGEACIWAPMDFRYLLDALTDKQTMVNFSGTSASTPHVASSLASVLAIFPETTPQNLVRLAKACAIPTPSLPGGVGRADFACMTTMGEDGEWRVVSADEFAGLVAPVRMNALVFPGDARITGTFVGRAGKPVELGTAVRGAFAFASGISGFSPGREVGAFPVVVGDGGNPSVGGGFMTDAGLFAAVAMGGRDGFFGLDGRYRYSGTRAVDMAFGYRHAYARFTRQWSAAPPLIGSVRGDAVGLTAEYSFETSPGTVVNFAGHMDRFAGGRADTIFGAVDIGASPWNRSAMFSVDHSLPNGATLSLSANTHWLAHGNDMGLSVGYRHRF